MFIKGRISLEKYVVKLDDYFVGLTFVLTILKYFLQRRFVRTYELRQYTYKINYMCNTLISLN